MINGKQDIKAGLFTEKELDAVWKKKKIKSRITAGLDEIPSAL